MAQEKNDGTTHPRERRVGTLVDRELLDRRIRQAVALAKGGAASRGYLLLREGREKVASPLSTEEPDTAELLDRWDAALRWMERYGPSALLSPAVPGRDGAN